MSEILPCQIEVLDGSMVSIDIHKKALGENLLREVYSHVGLEENDYFGLQFEDKNKQIRWLDPLKPIKKQMKNVRFSFYLRVRLYPISPTYLFDESTRYFLSLQIKEDLMERKLMCSDETRALLCSYLVQGEFGDYDPTEHQQGYLDDFQMLHNESIEFIQKVEKLHQEQKGMLPSECDKKFLDLSCKLEQYGMDFHPIMDINNIQLLMGITGRGLTVFCGGQSTMTALNQFPWVRISAINFKNKQLQVEMVPLPGSNYQEVLLFNSFSRSACKELWKSCVCHHTFFRSVRSDKIPQPNKVGLFRRGSTFRYSGRTQFRLLEDGTSTQRRSSIKFDRLGSRGRIARKTI